MNSKSADDEIRKGIQYVFDGLKPNCGADVTVPVSHTIDVADCEVFTAAEREKMFNELLEKALESARMRCELNGACPSVEIVGWDYTGTKCLNLKWTIEIDFVFKCVA